MMRMWKVIPMLVVGAALVTLAPSVANANCPGIPSMVLSNQFGGFVTNCPEPAFGYAYANGAAATVNSAGFNIVCNDASVSSQGVPCQPEAGLLNDGNVTVQFDWAPSTVNGCPNGSQVPNTGRNVYHVVCANGNSYVASVTWDVGLNGYLGDGAMQADPGSGAITPAVADKHTNAPTLTGSALGTGTSVSSVTVNVPVPVVGTDCDSGTLGFQLGDCGADTLPAATRGNAYIHTGACGQTPDLRKSQGWTGPFAPDGQGNVTIPLTVPTGLCAYVGITGNIGGETEILGSLVVGGPTVGTPKAIIDKVSHRAGTVSVDFHTTTELGAVGFNVLAGTRVLNTQLIAATGVNGAGAKYHFEVDRNALRNARTIVVQTRTTNGGTIDSAPAALSK